MKKTLPWLFLILGIIFSTIIWNFISLPYNSSNTIIGQYSLNKINPLNDTLRGLFFIFFPLFLYFAAFLKYNNMELTLYKIGTAPKYLLLDGLAIKINKQTSKES